MTMTDKQRPVVPPMEVRLKAPRRTFSAEYKARILAEADSCTKPGIDGRRTPSLHPGAGWMEGTGGASALSAAQ